VDLPRLGRLTLTRLRALFAPATGQHQIRRSGVALSTRAKRDRNPFLRASSDALTAAVPYCDIVGAENAQAHALTVTRLADRRGTAIMR
jgi:hypothetical protein